MRMSWVGLNVSKTLHSVGDRVWKCLFAQLSAYVGSKYVSAHSNLGASLSASGYRKKGGPKSSYGAFC